MVAEGLGKDATVLIIGGLRCQAGKLVWGEELACQVKKLGGCCWIDLASIPTQ